MADNTNVTAVPAVSSTLYYRRQHPGGGPLGRCSYGVPGVKGIVVIDMGLFPDGIAPATITVNVALSQPTPSKSVANVTSAVVAAANTAVAQATSTPIAPPAQVAAVVAQGAGVLVGASKSGATTPAAPAKGKSSK